MSRLKFLVYNRLMHGLRTPREEIAFAARPKIQSQSQIFRYGRSIFCLPHQPNFSDILDLCLHWVSAVRGINDYLPRSSKKSNTWHRFFFGIRIKDCAVWPLIGITRYWSYRRFQLWKKYLEPLLRNNLLLHKKETDTLNIFKLEVTKMCFVEKCYNNKSKVSMFCINLVRKGQGISR